MENEFHLPENLKTDREYGQLDPKFLKNRSDDKHSSEIGKHTLDFHLPKKTIYSQDLLQMNESTIQNPASKDVITLIGVLPSQVQLVSDYFRFHNYFPIIEPENTDEMVGNWIYLKFNVPISRIPIIKSVIQINSHFFVGCFLGRYQYENIQPIPLPFRPPEDVSSKLFRIRHPKNLVNGNLENQSFVTKFKHFVLGIQEIEVYNDA